MKIGVILPTFRDGAHDALAAGAACEAAGLDGVFAYDHLWPMGRPDRPSLAPFPLLAAIAASTSSIAVAPLVARVGVVSTAALVQQFATLALIAPGRVLAPLGTGDSLSREENIAYGLGFASARVRRELLAEAAAAIAPVAPVWIGAGAPETNELARAGNYELTVWNASPHDVAAFALDGPVNWAGDPASDLDAHLKELEVAGAL